MAEDEIMIEDDAIALEDTDDSAEADADVSNIIPFIMERYSRAEDYRYQDEERWLRAYRNYRDYMVQMFSLLKQKNLVYLLKLLKLKRLLLMVKSLMFYLLIISFLFLLSLQHSPRCCS